MSKKKAIICTIIFAIVIYSILVISIFVDLDGDGRTISGTLFPIITGLWVTDFVKRFYKWLKKDS